MLKKFIVLAATLLLAASALAQNSAYPPFYTHIVGGRVIAAEYGRWTIHSINAVSAGAGTMTLDNCFINVGADNRKIFPFAPGGLGPFPSITVVDGSNTETALAVTGVTTPTAAGPSAVNAFSCSITATFANAHSTGVTLVSGDNGLLEAALDAAASNVGLVTIDSTSGITAAQLIAATVVPTVAFEDLRQPAAQYWNLSQTASTFLAVPSTLTATTVGFALNGANATGGAYTGNSTYHVCVAYVDVAGQEGACSADFSGLTAGTSAATYQIGFAAPAASTGAVGYTVYISLASGTYSLAYQVPLTSTVCKLTTIETVTPACALTNTTYNQVGSAAVVSALTLSTSPVDMQLAGVSGTLLTGNPNGRTTYGYVAASHLAPYGILPIYLAFTAGGIGSATPIAIGTFNIPAGAFNMVGNQLRICGKYANTDASSTVQNINIYYDAPGSNTAGSPVQIASLAASATTIGANPGTGNFCWNGHTTVAGAGATAGSIIGDFSLLNYYLSATPAVTFLGGDSKTAAVGSLNLAGTAGFSTRISIVHTNTSGNNTPQLVALTFEDLN